MDTVLYMPFTTQDDDRFQHFERLIEHAALRDIIKPGNLVAIKLHVGEKNRDTYVEPGLVRVLVEHIQKLEAKPFLTDTNVLYHSQRSNAVDHILLAHEHGFSIEQMGCPFIVADGLLGRDERKVSINGRHYQEVPIASLAADADAIVVVSHFTGHLGTGFGATIKNLGMGFSARKGKLSQHSDMAPFIRQKSCTLCGACVRNCPVAAISLGSKAAVIDADTCIGCGECISVCRFHAVSFNWSTSSPLLQQKMAEHALGVHKQKQGRVAYINILTQVTQDCDCIPRQQEPLFPDIGALAGRDPVAVDQASYDLVKEQAGKTIEALSYPNLDGTEQIRFAEEIGLGSRKYELVHLDK